MQLANDSELKEKFDEFINEIKKTLKEQNPYFVK